ncbi:MAG TPA: ABC transporter ATP-binding protein [Verrucomicrobiales bacterium]|nr:ABC transporter ATP-binding protein [Verrucomicrobiales bacterium]
MSSADASTEAKGPPLLKVSGLRKSFARRPALHGLDFEVRDGEIFGLLGHNGSGKSTTIGIILGLVHADGGLVEVAGISVARERERAMRQVGAIFESPRFYEYLTGWRNLQVLTSFSGGVSRAAMEEAVRWVGLEDRIHDQVGTYSQGMRQRLALAQALLPRPRLLILDEPTNGLDPDGIVDLRHRIRKLRDDFAITVIVCSHLLVEVEQLCDRVVILRSGHKVYEGACRGLEEPGRRYRLEAEPRDAMLGVLHQLGGSLLPDGEVFLPEATDVADLVKGLVSAGVAIRGLTRQERTLEQVYLETRTGSP